MNPKTIEVGMIIERNMAGQTKLVECISKQTNPDGSIVIQWREVVSNG